MSQKVNSIKEAISLADKLDKIGDEEVSHLLYNIAKVFYEKSLAVRIEWLGESSLEVATSYDNIAFIHLDKSNYEVAKSFFEKALSIRLNWLDKNSLEVATSYFNLSLLHLQQGGKEVAKSFYEKGVAIRQHHGILKRCQMEKGLATLFFIVDLYLLK
jgi:tetratricopeptide (TPR) repeat protein